MISLNTCQLIGVGDISAQADQLLCLACITLDLPFTSLHRYLDGSLYSVFALAPLMLMLSPGKTLFRYLTEENRYAPVRHTPYTSHPLSQFTRC